MVKISDLPVLLASGITDYTVIELGVDDTGMSASMSITLDELRKAIKAPVSAATASDGDTTPTVAGVNSLKSGNTGATSVTDFDDGLDGQLLTFLIDDGNTTVVHNASLIKLNGAVNFVPGSGGGSISFENVGGVWWETGRAAF